jgi:hypothetical protein
VGSLIPQDLPNRKTVLRQVDEMRVNITTRINKTFILDLSDRRVEGSPVKAHAAFISGPPPSLVVSEECAAAKTPSYEVVRLLADTFQITDPKSFPLLYTALSDMNASLQSIRSSFTQQGVYVQGPELGALILHYLFPPLEPYWKKVNSVKQTSLQTAGGIGPATYPAYSRHHCRASAHWGDHLGAMVQM